VSVGWQTVVGWIAGVISLLGFLPYAVAVLRRTARPNRATWVIWTIVGSLLFASYDASVGGAARWVPLGDVIGTAVIAVLSIRDGEGGVGRFDLGCFGLAGLSVIGWALTGTAALALDINIFLALLGALPTIRKAYKDPTSESALTWRIFFVGNALNLVAIEAWSVQSAAYPLYTALMAALMNALLHRDARRGPSEPANPLTTNRTLNPSDETSRNDDPRRLTARRLAARERLR
jgi:hypothetical protein